MSTSPPLIVADRYRLVAPLGQGGMGRVWRATDVVLHREVAIKELVPPPGLTPEERQEMRERSLREARAIARLNNINVVRVFDVLRTDADPWIVMEYVPSRSLQDILAQDGPFAPVRAAEIGLGVLNALRAAHRAGVVHRDVKPGNVLISEDGRVVLTDFGLATVPGDPNVTRTGLVLGSPAYIAPERARDGTAGPGADLWSLGATLYAAVEGASPFARPSAIATLAALATENPPSARNAGPLKPVLNGLLRKDPAHRINAEEAERLLLRATGRRSKLSFPMSPTMRRPGIGRERPSVNLTPPVVPGVSASAPVVPGPRPPVTPARPSSTPMQPPGIPARSHGTPTRPPINPGQPPAAGGRAPVFVPGKAAVARPPAETPTRVDGAKPPELDATKIEDQIAFGTGPASPPPAGEAPAARRPALDATMRGSSSAFGSITADEVAAHRKRPAAQAFPATAPPTTPPESRQPTTQLPKSPTTAPQASAAGSTVAEPTPDAGTKPHTPVTGRIIATASPRTGPTRPDEKPVALTASAAAATTKRPTDTKPESATPDPDNAARPEIAAWGPGSATRPDSAVSGPGSAASADDAAKATATTAKKTGPFGPRPSRTDSATPPTEVMAKSTAPEAEQTPTGATPPGAAHSAHATDSKAAPAEAELETTDKLEDSAEKAVAYKAQASAERGVPAAPTATAATASDPAAMTLTDTATPASDDESAIGSDATGTASHRTETSPDRTGTPPGATKPAPAATATPTSDTATPKSETGTPKSETDTPKSDTPKSDDTPEPGTGARSAEAAAPQAPTANHDKPSGAGTIGTDARGAETATSKFAEAGSTTEAAADRVTKPVAATRAAEGQTTKASRKKGRGRNVKPAPATAAAGATAPTKRAADAAAPSAPDAAAPSAPAAADKAAATDEAAGGDNAPAAADHALIPGKTAATAEACPTGRVGTRATEVPATDVRRDATAAGTKSEATPAGAASRETAAEASSEAATASTTAKSTAAGPGSEAATGSTTAKSTATGPGSEAATASTTAKSTATGPSSEAATAADAGSEATTIGAALKGTAAGTASEPATTGSVSKAGPGKTAAKSPPPPKSGSEAAAQPATPRTNSTPGTDVGRTRVLRTPAAAPSPDEPADAVSGVPPFGKPTRPAWQPMPVREPSAGSRGITVFGTTLTRRQTVIAIAVLVAVLLALVVLVPRAFGDEPDDARQAGVAPAASATGGKPSTAPSSSPAAAAPAATTPATTPASKPATSKPAAAVRVPKGWYLYNGDGYSLPVPNGVSVRPQGSEVYFSKDNRLLIIDHSENPKPDPVADWKNQEAQRRGTKYQNYRRIKLVGLDFHGKAADWEFTYTTDGGNPQHALKRAFITTPGKQAYSISWYTSPGDWAASQKDLQVIYQGFKPER